MQARYIWLLYQSAGVARVSIPLARQTLPPLPPPGRLQPAGRPSEVASFGLLPRGGAARPPRGQGTGWLAGLLPLPGLARTASFRTFNLEELAQPLGTLSFWRGI